MVSIFRPSLQMHVLLLMVLHAALCCASSESNKESIETLMDHGLLLLFSLQNRFTPHLIVYLT